MRIPLSWLREYTELPDTATPKEVHAALVRVGFEEEATHGFDVQGPVVVAEVLSFEPETHSNGKTVNWCQVRVGEDQGDVRGIVCGAHNYRVGDMVVAALPGATLPGGFNIAARKTYGHISDGMLASARELGLGDDHDGIIVLPRFGIHGAKPGQDALALLGMQDSAVEVNVTPDRGYAFSIRGIAREYSHATGSRFTDPATTVSPVEASGFPVEIDDARPIRGRVGATTFVARVVRDIDASAQTPAWLISRLALSGIRSLNLPADISNYVMLEMGAPLHVYDLDRLKGGITVRRALPGEKLQTLDGQVRVLHPEDLAIADDSGVVGLAGVMGGEGTKVTDGTRNVLIEAAIFDPVSIARTARRHKLPSEASKRFERGVDSQVARQAAARMVDLLVRLAGGKADSFGAEILCPARSEGIRFSVRSVNALVGADYTREEILRALELIGCVISEGADVAGEAVLSVIAPSWRSDLTRSADLVEEVARIVGYDRIPSRLPQAPAGRGLTREQKLRRRVADAVAAQGFTEVQWYPFTGRAELDTFGATVSDVMAANTGAVVAGVEAKPVQAGVSGAVNTGSAVEAGVSAGFSRVQALRLANPLDAEAPFLRRSLLPGLVGAAKRNVSRGFTSLALFEVGSVFVPGVGSGVVSGVEDIAVLPPCTKPSVEQLRAVAAGLPAQPRLISGVLLGDVNAKSVFLERAQYSWWHAVQAAEAIAAVVGVRFTVRQGCDRAFHPGRTAALFMDAPHGLQLVGVAGELLSEVTLGAHLPGRVSAFELNLDVLLGLAPRVPCTSAISGFPAATQDVTLVVSVDVAAGELLEVVRGGAGELLEEISLVDDYRGVGLPAGVRALTFALRFRAVDRTLTAEEASAAKMAGVAAAHAAYGAVLRE